MVLYFILNTMQNYGNLSVVLAQLEGHQIEMYSYCGYKSTAVMFSKSELSRFDAQIRMAEGSLRKAAPILNLMSKNISDDLSVGYRLKTYFNYYIKNSNSDMGKVATMQKQFRDYYENFINMEIDSRKTPRGKEKFIIAKKDNLQFIDRN